MKSAQIVNSHESIEAFTNYNTFDSYSVRQKIACDVCVQKVKDCSTYKPNTAQFNPVRPPPSSLGKLKVCEASEREIWSVGDYFKVAGSKGYNTNYDALVLANPTANFGTETRAGTELNYALFLTQTRSLKTSNITK